MSIIDRTKSSAKNIYEKATSKWSSFKDRTNKKTLSLGEKLSQKYNWIRSESEERYDSLSNRYKVRKYNFRRKLDRKWQRKWSRYFNYFVWDLTPLVVVHGLALNLVLSQVGLLAFTPLNVIASGLAFYYTKVEFVEWMNSIDWLHKDSSSEV